MSFFKFTRKQFYGGMTDAVNAWWNKIYRPSDFYDKMEIPLTIHLCGSEDIIKAKYEEVFGKKVDYLGTAGLANIDPRDGKCHIFVIAATEVEFATTVMNYFTAGHEMGHIINYLNEKRDVRLTYYPNPDEFHT